MSHSESHTPRRHSGKVHSKIEREVKLSIDAGFRLPALPGISLPGRFITSTYYDTSGYNLAHAGITLRHRVERGKQAWQLKLPLIKDRQEIELVDRQPNPPMILQDLLFLHLGQQELGPIATLRVWRRGVCVRSNHIPIAAVTLDHVSVMQSGTVIQRFREVEIEQLNGKNSTLPDLERQLRRAGAEDHDGRPKLFRALSLPPPRPAPPPTQNAPVVEHVQWAFARQVRWLLAHDPGARFGREPESLHQMRVATRQLRAILRAAGPLLVPEWADSLRNELRWLGHLLGPARDLDVQLAYFREESASLGARDRRPLAQFITHLETERNNAQEILLNELKGARYLDLIRRLQQTTQDLVVIETTITLTDLAKHAFESLKKSIQRLGTSPSDDTLHKIRIKIKRARYAAELAGPMAGKAATRFVKRTSALQDVLGRHQDAIQAEAHVRAFLKQSSNVRAAFVAGRMVERARERRKEARSTLRHLWKGLLKRGEKAWG
jgi:CHAD domain-containing protein